MNGLRVEEEIATSRVKEILKGVYNGERAKLAEAITLGELHVSPWPCRCAPKPVNISRAL